MLQEPVLVGLGRRAAHRARRHGRLAALRTHRRRAVLAQRARHQQRLRRAVLRRRAGGLHRRVRPGRQKSPNTLL